MAEARLSWWSGGNELSCVKVYDSPRGGQILLHLNKVSTSASLWQLLTGACGCLGVHPCLHADVRIPDDEAAA